MEATLLDFITWLINLRSLASPRIQNIYICFSLVQFRENVRQVVLHVLFLALRGLKRT